MAIIRCPECGKEVSTEAVACLNCGYPVAKILNSESQTNITVNQTDNTESQTNHHSEPKKKTSGVAIAVVAIIAVVGILVGNTLGNKITYDSVKKTELYNVELGIGLKLGMEKEEVDELLGEPVKEFGNYLYTDSYMYTTFFDGKLASMYIEYPNDRWVTENELTIDSPGEDIKSAFGEPQYNPGDDEWWYYITGNTVSGFKVVNERVFSIYIYDSNVIQGEE